MEKIFESLSRIDRLELANYGLRLDSVKKVLSSSQVLTDANRDTCLVNFAGIRIIKNSKHAKFSVDYNQPILIKREPDKKVPVEFLINIYPFGVGFDERKNLDYKIFQGKDVSPLREGYGIEFYQDNEKIRVEFLGELEAMTLNILPINQIQPNLFHVIKEEYGLKVEETSKKERYSMHQEFLIQPTKPLARMISLNLTLENRKKLELEEIDDPSLKDIGIYLGSSKRDLSLRLREYVKSYANAIKKEIEMPMHDGKSITIFPSTSQMVHLDNIFGMLYERN